MRPWFIYEEQSDDRFLVMWPCMTTYGHVTLSAKGHVTIGRRTQADNVAFSVSLCT